MDQTLSALGDILLKALPTFFLVIFLYLYLRKTFFGPLGKVLAERREATSGARQRAEEMFQKAEQKAAEYEAKLQAARSEIFRELDAERQRAVEAQAARVKEARDQADAQVREARAQIAQDVVAAKHTLGAQVEFLSDQIVQRVLTQ
jgi:F-type H+-transporting ATPase subunit b